MDLKQLKENIKGKKLNNDILIFKYTDTDFIVNQYIQEIVKLKNKELFYLEDLMDLKNNNPLLEDNYIYIYHTDKLNININKPNLIIICKDIDKDIKPNLFNLIEVPKLEKWQIEDYVRINLSKLKEDNIILLCNLCNYSVDRIDKEIKKLKLLNNVPQDYDLISLIEGDNFKDSSPFNIFNLSNAIIKRDKKQIKEILKSNLKVEPMALISLLIKNFINILNIQTNQRITPEDLGLNYNQFMALKYNCGRYTNEEVIFNLKLLTQSDYDIKSGNIPYDKYIDYLLINIL